MKKALAEALEAFQAENRRLIETLRAAIEADYRERQDDDAE